MLFTATSCLILCDPMDCNTPGFLVLPLSLGVCSNSCPLSQLFYPTISCSVVPFSSCLQSFPAFGFFPMSWLFASGGQSIGTSASAVGPSNKYSGLISFRIDWLDLPVVQGTLKSLFQHHGSKGSIFGAQPSWWSNSHIYI